MLGGAFQVAEAKNHALRLGRRLAIGRQEAALAPNDTVNHPQFTNMDFHGDASGTDAMVRSGWSGRGVCLGAPPFQPHLSSRPLGCAVRNSVMFHVKRGGSRLFNGGCTGHDEDDGALADSRLLRLCRRQYWVCPCRGRP